MVTTHTTLVSIVFTAIVKSLPIELIEIFLERNIMITSNCYLIGMNWVCGCWRKSLTLCGCVCWPIHWSNNLSSPRFPKRTDVETNFKSKYLCLTCVCQITSVDQNIPSWQYPKFLLINAVFILQETVEWMWLTYCNACVSEIQTIRTVFGGCCGGYDTEICGGSKKVEIRAHARSIQHSESCYVLTDPLTRVGGWYLSPFFHTHDRRTVTQTSYTPPEHSLELGQWWAFCKTWLRVTPDAGRVVIIQYFCLMIDQWPTVADHWSCMR